jgi:hypothetical protein
MLVRTTGVATAALPLVVAAGFCVLVTGGITGGAPRAVVAVFVGASVVAECSAPAGVVAGVPVTAAVVDGEEETTGGFWASSGFSVEGLSVFAVVVLLFPVGEAE